MRSLERQGGKKQSQERTAESASIFALLLHHRLTTNKQTANRHAACVREGSERESGRKATEERRTTKRQWMMMMGHHARNTHTYTKLCQRTLGICDRCATKMFYQDLIVIYYRQETPQINAPPFLNDDVVVIWGEGKWSSSQRIGEENSICVHLEKFLFAIRRLWAT